LRDYSHSGDNTVIKLALTDGSEMSFDKSNSAWDSAVSYNGAGRATVNVGAFMDSGFDEAVSRLTVTETRGSIYVNSVSYELATVPEPATLALLGLGCLAALPFKKK
jgi:hypothetical protein